MSSLAAVLPQLRRLRMNLSRESLRRALTGTLHPSILGILPCVAFFIMLRLNPFSAGWRVIYQGLALYLWWPIPVYLCVFFFLLAGWLRHRQTGASLPSPRLALVTASVLLVILLDLITEWAVWRSLLWYGLVHCAGVLAALLLVAGCVCYRETWRRYHNSSVVKRVSKSLRDGSFSRYLQGLYIPWVPAPRWGSPHCLLIVLGHYQEAKAALRNHLTTKDVQLHLDHCIRAGEVLAAYLRLRWADQTPLSVEWRVRLGDLYRELLTLALWAHSINSRVRIDTARMNEWRRNMREAFATPFVAYATFLEIVLCPPRGGDGRPVPEAETIEQLLRLYGEIPQSPLTMQDRSYDARRIARDTFVAAASQIMPETVVLDVWLVLHDKGADPLADSGDQENDPSDSWARQQVHRLYQNWAGRVPAEWTGLLSSRATRANARQMTPVVSSPDLHDSPLSRTAAASSWAYLFVWLTPRVLMHAIFSSALVFALHAIALIAVTPGVIFNDVLAVRDLRPFHDYSQSEIYAMAGSDDTIALATSDGLQFLDKASYLIHSHSPSGVAAWDVTRYPGTNEFMVLSADQGIRQVTPSLLGQDRIWLPPPATPYWRGESDLDAHSILTSQFDHDGWLVAARGRGLSRYQFSSDEHAKMYRTRSWQQSPLSEIDLQQAIMTERGVWLVSSSRVDFADRTTLQALRPRGFAQSLSFLDADPKGTWAAGAAANGSAWLLPPNDGATWAGPFFCGQQNELQSLENVTIARRTPGTAWLGTQSGLYKYDLGKRCLSTAIQKEAVRALIPFQSDSADIAVATNLKLRLLSPVSEKVLDEGAIQALNITADSGTAFYLRQINSPQSNDQIGFEVRRIDLAHNGQPETVISAQGMSSQGWFASPSLDMLHVAASSSEELLFVSSRGAFYYDPQLHKYRNCSKANIHTSNGEYPVDLKEFKSVTPGSQRVLAITDQGPQALRRGQSNWTNLESPGKSDPFQIAEINGRAFALGSSGQIYQYESKPTSYLERSSTALTSSIPESNSFKGDLLPQEKGFRLAMAYHDTLITYDSNSSELMDYPGSLAPLKPVQVRFSSEGDIFLLSQTGSINKLDQNGLSTIFGSSSTGSLDDIRAIAPGLEEHSVLVGGSSGLLASYNWQTGSWTPRLRPSDLGYANISSIEMTKAGWLLGTSSGKYLYWNKKTLYPFSGYTRMTNSDSVLAGLGPNGVEFLSPSTAESSERWVRTRSSTGLSMDEFLPSAVVAWNIGPQSVAFFTHDCRVAEYNLTRQERWREFCLPNVQSLSQIQYGSNCLYALAYSPEGQRVLRITSSLMNPEVLTTLPQNVEHSSLRVVSSLQLPGLSAEVRLAYTSAFAAHVRNFPENKPGPEAARGGEFSSEFNPSDAILAFADNRSLVLVDQVGRVVAYDPSRGTWINRRNTNHDQIVVGWRFPTGSGIPVVVIRNTLGNLLEVDPSQGSEHAIATLPSGLILPADGSMLTAGGMRVVRKGGRTRIYESGVGELHFGKAGFDEDQYLDVAVSLSGDIWALSRAGLVRLEFSGGQLKLASTPRPVIGNATSIQQLLPQFPDLGLNVSDPRGTLATMAVGDERLNWVHPSEMGIQAQWATTGTSTSKSALGRCGKVSFECIEDIAVAPSGELLVSTELGLLICDPATYIIRRIESLNAPFGNNRFLPMSAPKRLFLRSGDDFFAWLPNQKFERVTGVPSDVVETGPWVWTLLLGERLTVTKGGGSPRLMIRDASGMWKFKDDFVQWIYRTPEDFVLATSGDKWNFLAGQGRTSEYSGSTSIDTYEQRTPAMTFEYKQGQLQLHPIDSDSQPAIENGRLFFDNGFRMSGSRSRGVNDIFVYVNRRCILRRDVNHPTTILQAWASPTALKDSTNVGMEATAEGIRLRGDGMSYELNLISGTWTQHTWNEHEQQSIAAGSIDWHASSSGTKFLPYYKQAKIDHWWSSDRFSWDRINDLAVLSKDLVAFASDAGPWVAKFTASDWQLVAFKPETPIQHVSVARSSGVPVGVLMTDYSEARYLITNSSSQIEIRAYAGPPLLEHAVVDLRYERGPENSEVLGIGERWTTSLDEHAAQVHLGDGWGKILKGQFDFDGFKSAAPLGNTWAISNCSGQCLITRNELSPAGLLLKAVNSAPCEFGHLRSNSVKLIGVCTQSSEASPSPWEFDPSNNAWSQIGFDRVASDFVVGSRILFSATSLAWKAVAAQYPWSNAPLTVFPEDYPLFVKRAGGNVLSFDEFTAISIDSTGDRLDIGTLGGLFTWPTRNDGRGLLEYDTGTISLDFGQVGIERLRRSPGGNLWVKIGTGAIARHTGFNQWQLSDLKNWPDPSLIVDGFHVDVGSNGISDPDQQKLMHSNNAWRIGDKPIENIVDFSKDPTSLWVATRHHGVFQIKLLDSRPPTLF